MLKLISTGLALLMISILLAQSHQAEVDCVRRVVSLEYPQIAGTARIQGTIVVEARVDETGRVVSAEGISGHQLLKRAAIAKATAWRFKPGADRTLRITYEFKLVEPALDYIPPTRLTFDLPTHKAVY